MYHARIADRRCLSCLVYRACQLITTVILIMIIIITIIIILRITILIIITKT